MSIMYKLFQIAFFPIIKIFFPTKVINKKEYKKLRKQKFKHILASNHLSWVDIPLLAVDVPGFRHVVAKKEIGKNPIVRWGTRCMKMILVDRGKADLSAVKQAIRYLKDGGSLSVFPEGTRNKVDESFQDAKGGVVVWAVKGDAAIIPAILYRKPKVFRKNYIYIDEPFYLNEYKTQRLSGEVMEEAIKKVEEKMQAAYDKLDQYLLSKNKKLKVNRAKTDKAMDTDSDTIKAAEVSKAEKAENDLELKATETAIINESESEKEVNA